MVQKKTPSMSKMRILSKKNNKSKKQLVFKNSINKLIKENQPLSSKARKNSKILENIIKKLRKNVDVSKCVSPEKCFKKSSKMKILSKEKLARSREKLMNEKFKIVLPEKENHTKRENLKNKRELKPLNMYVNLNKMVSAKARSIDFQRKKKSGKAYHVKNDFLSEDKQTQKYLLKNKPSYINVDEK